MAQGVTGYVNITNANYGTTFRIDYSQTYDEDTNKSVVTITDLRVASTKYAGLYYFEGKITIGGKTAITMSGFGGTHRASINYSNGTFYNVGGSLGSVTIEHDANGEATVAIALSSVKGIYDGDGKTKFTVSGSKSVTLTKIEPSGYIYIDNGTSFDKYEVYIDNGTSWDRYIPYIDNGSGWDKCG